VQLLRRGADDTPSSIALPNGQLYRGRDNSSPTRMGSRGTAEVFLALNGDELEFEHLPITVDFLPGVNEVEDAVVRPYALPQLLVYPHAFRGPLPVVVLLGGSMESSVLGKGAVGGTLGLVYGLGLGHRRATRLIVAFVDEGGSVILEPIPVRSIRTDMSTTEWSPPSPKFISRCRLVHSRAHISR